jgi:hypothetical protein
VIDEIHDPTGAAKIPRIGSAKPQHPACWQCLFYSPGDGQNLEQGLCRLLPPKAFILKQPSGATSTITVWPVVKNQIDWCGSFAESSVD